MEAIWRPAVVLPGVQLVVNLERFLAVALLAAFIWAMRVQLPRARRDGGWFAFLCALVTALAALFAWLLLGIRVR